jgi:subtilase family serine protease
MAVAQEDGRTPSQVEPQSEPAAGVEPAIVGATGQVVVPETSVARSEDAGLRAHTNHLIFVPSGRQMASPIPDYTYAETPASMGCVYKVGPSYSGCKPSTGGSKHPTGGWGAIALVDAYDNPKAASDLAHFSSYFGIPAANFKKVYANSSFGTLHGISPSCSGTPAGNMGWGLEEDLDIEWAHAMAPSAKIILVEACSNSYNDLFYAEQVAGIEVYAAGGGDISNSWGGGEFGGEISADLNFFDYYWSHVTYFASAGDSGWGAAYPSSSPWVVSAGGTTVNRDANQNFVSETCWSGSGGGVSRYETWQNPPTFPDGMGPWVDYQYPLFGRGSRVTPDMSFNANPASGVYVYDTYENTPGWWIVGGTSVASPSLAGIVNASNNRLGQGVSGGYYTSEENNLIYAEYLGATTYSSDFYDVKSGSNGSGHNAGTGYDQCTGIGSPRGHVGK